MDIQITQWINGLAGQNPAFDTLMIWITQLGVPVIVVLVALHWFSRTDRPQIRYAAICAGLSFLLGLAINQGLLLLIHRVRPYNAGVSHLIIPPSADWSFPSDHATASIAVAISFLMSGLRNRAAALFAMAAFVCLSRVYIGTHYVSDVLGGAATGILAAIAVHFIYREDSRLNQFATKIL
jgi:undecaprenyl-diphosphatase